jgi:glycine betaine catabolism A
VFVNLSRTPAAPLMERLGEIPTRTRNYPLADLRVARRIAYDVATNWKVVVENYNECYHCGPVHPELCEVVPAFKDGGRELDWDAGVPHRDGATTFTRDGTTTRAPFPGLSEDERTRHKGELLYPNMMLSLSSDHVAAFTLWPLEPDRTRIDCDLLFHPDEIARHGFDPSDAVEFWDLVNRQDWRICEAVQDGMGSTVFDTGFYAPMEDLSLDIRRYVADRLGDAWVDGSPRTLPSAGEGRRPSR